MLYHSGVSVLSGGFVGVDVFFVISGFLITSHLWSEISTKGRLDFGAFYARRARRILPASFAVLVLSVIAAVVFMPPLQLPDMFQAAIATAFYVPNVLFAVKGTNYLSEEAPSLFQHYWSLGIEEQFYLLWPLLVVAAFLLWRTSFRGLTITLAVVVVGSYAASILYTPINSSYAFFLLPTRAWELGVGGLLGLLVFARPRWLDAAVVGVLGWVGLALVAVAAFAFTSETPFPGWIAIVPVAGTALVILSGSGSARFGPQRALSLRPAMWIGTISYSLYLVHWPLQIIPQEAVGLQNPLPLWVKLLLGAVAFPLAWLSYRFVEEPMRRARFLVSARPRRTLIGVLVVPLLVLGVAFAGTHWVRAQPLATTTVVAETVVSVPPVGTGVVPENLQPRLWTSGSDNPEAYANGCHRPDSSTDSSGCRIGDNPDAPLVALFGDSHATQWYPALVQLAEAGVIRLDSNSKSSCASAQVPEPDYPACTTWREGVIERLSAEQPRLVLLANYARAQSASVGFTGAQWADALRETIDRFSGDTLVAVVADTPEAHATPAICLSAHLDDTAACDLRRSVALDQATRDAQTTLGVPVIDLTDRFCTDQTCPVIIGNSLVYRDAHHITQTYSSALAPALGEELARVLDVGR